MIFARILAALLCGLACVGAVAEEDWETPDWKSAAGERRASLRDLVLIEGDSKNPCGEHDFSVYASARSDLPAFSYCANTLKYRPHGRMPDFLVSGVRVGSDIGGPSGWTFQDILLRYDQGKWTETVILAIGGSEKVD